MARTITEKILAAHAMDGEIAAGAIATIRPDVVLLNDVSGPLAFAQFAAMGATRVFDAERVVLVADHFAPAKDVESAEQLRLTARFAQQYGLRHHYGPGRGGIEHTLIAELGLVGHGDVVFGADSHTCTAGAFNALGIGFGSSDLAAALATGRLWLRVPATIRVDLVGQPGPFVSGKDVILELIRRVGSDGALDCSLEFGGAGVSALSVDARMAPIAASSRATRSRWPTCRRAAWRRDRPYCRTPARPMRSASRSTSARLSRWWRGRPRRPMVCPSAR
jgi:3-isopropylmalate/(R)-2-methylmalate dehydratase large subunit